MYALGYDGRMHLTPPPFFRRLQTLVLSVIALLMAASAPVASGDEGALRFVPLPMEDRKILLAQFRPMLGYLELTTGIELELDSYGDYETILQGLLDDRIDLAYLGPLPYVLLTERDDDFRPLVRFLNAEGESQYTCALARFGKQPARLRDVGRTRISLTQPYSTCGYLATEELLQHVGRSLAEIAHFYAGSHSESMLSLVRGEAEIGSARTSIVRKYRHLNVEVITQSPPLPGFVLVANPRTTTEAQREAIRDALLSIEPLTDPDDRTLTRDWGEAIRHGSIPADDGAYAPVRRLYRALPDGIPGIAR